MTQKGEALATQTTPAVIVDPLAQGSAGNTKTTGTDVHGKLKFHF